jgi:hypothetical protein
VGAQDECRWESNTDGAKDQPSEHNLTESYEQPLPEAILILGGLLLLSGWQPVTNKWNVQNIPSSWGEFVGVRGGYENKRKAEYIILYQ